MCTSRTLPSTCRSFAPTTSSCTVRRAIRRGGPCMCGLKNEFSFPTIRLWEHADQIRGGTLPELAPLLALCEDRPTEQTMREEREIILRLDTTPEVRAELLA